MDSPQPVALGLEIPSDAGIVNCCSSPSGRCTNFVHVPSSACFAVGVWCRCQAYPICPGTPDAVCYVPSSPPVEPSVPPADNQCVCQDEASETLLRNLLALDKGESNLKRVHSDPVKVRNHVQRMRQNQKTSLAYSHSLDSKKRNSNRLRLRTDSSRLISHHSSSSEEWFEEVPPSPPRELRLNTKIASEAEHDETLSAILRTPKVVQAQNSLSNLLITKCNAETRSQSDESSLRADAASSVAPCPCTAQDPPPKSSEQCCCVVS